MDSLIPEMELFRPERLAASLVPYLPPLLLEIAVAVWMLLGSKRSGVRHESLRLWLARQEQGWLVFPLLVWALWAQPPILSQQGLVGPSWKEVLTSYYLHVFGCFLALSLMLFGRSVWLTYLKKPAASAGLAPPQLAVFMAIFFTVLLENLVTTAVFYR